jgi:hypothetical protein
MYVPARRREEETKQPLARLFKANQIVLNRVV